MTEEPEVYDDNDTVFGDWSGAVPWNMKRWTEHKLQMAHVHGSSQTVRFVEAELSRRRNNELKSHIQSLKDATDLVRKATIAVDGGVGILANSSSNLESLTRRLIKATKEVHGEIQSLSSSSDRLEDLTRKLKNLTWALIWLTVAAVVLPVGIEAWKAMQPEKPVPTAAPLSPQTAPQTPIPPAPQSHP